MTIKLTDLIEQLQGLADEFENNYDMDPSEVDVMIAIQQGHPLTQSVHTVTAGFEVDVEKEPEGMAVWIASSDNLPNGYSPYAPGVVWQ